jgi:hypothetical protein
MVKPDILASKLKSEIDSQSTGSGGGSDSMIAKNQFKSSIPANGIANEEITKKRMNKKTKISKEENKEATGAGSAGGFEAPLFSTTKKEMEEGDVTKIEATEATGAGSSGSYETTSFLAKSQSKKDWRGKSKTQIPGGKFVQVKKKCQKFPYCNQGDIKALKIFENEKVKNAIQNISKRHNISENVIKTIIAYEYENTFSK